MAEALPLLSTMGPTARGSISSSIYTCCRCTHTQIWRKFESLQNSQGGEFLWFLLNCTVRYSVCVSAMVKLPSHCFAMSIE